MLIENDAYGNLSHAVAEIKESQAYSKINEGTLASEIINHFFRRYYSKDKKFLSKKFFNKRAFLKNLIQGQKSDEELIKSFERHLKNPSKRRPSLKLNPKNNQEKL